MSPARARTRTAGSGVERTNHEATAPPTCVVYTKIIIHLSEGESGGFRGKESFLCRNVFLYYIHIAVRLFSSKSQTTSKLVKHSVMTCFLMWSWDFKGTWNWPGFNYQPDVNAKTV